MIRAAIIGGNTQVADELTRILIHHPDVHIAWIEAGDVAGNRVADTYGGLAGDTDLRFVADGDTGEVDVVFVCRHIAPRPALNEPRLRVIDLVGEHRTEHGTEADGKYVYGLGELNRKAMVRGARRASLPTPAAHAALLALLPAAKSSLLTGQITIDGIDADVAAEISRVLVTLMPGFNGNVVAKSVAEHAPGERSLGVTVTFDSPKPLDDMRALYAEFYDDHNFTHIIMRAPRTRDVANTNKGLLHLSKPTAQTLSIDAMIDPYVKGAAGSAVHCMNLLFGLYERTGLTLKPSAL